MEYAQDKERALAALEAIRQKTVNSIKDDLSDYNEAGLYGRYAREERISNLLQTLRLVREREAEIIKSKV